MTFFDSVLLENNCKQIYLCGGLIFSYWFIGSACSSCNKPEIYLFIYLFIYLSYPHCDFTQRAMIWDIVAIMPWVSQTFFVDTRRKTKEFPNCIRRFLTVPEHYNVFGEQMAVGISNPPAAMRSSAHEASKPREKWNEFKLIIHSTFSITSPLGDY